MREKRESGYIREVTGLVYLSVCLCIGDTETAERERERGKDSKGGEGRVLCEDRRASRSGDSGGPQRDQLTGEVDADRPFPSLPKPYCFCSSSSLL